MDRFTPTHVTIDLRALLSNFRVLKRRLPRGAASLCVVKSDAYGHGATQVALALQKETDAFGVGTVDEAIALREAGVDKPILVLLGCVKGACDLIVKSDLTPVVYDLESARELDAAARTSGKIIKIHLKVDTGMTRLGVMPGDFANFCNSISHLRSLAPMGLLTHLSEASEAKFTAKQMRTFEECRRIYVSSFGEGIFHAANSQASLDRNVGAPAGKRMARFGIALYGAYPSLKSEKKKRTIALRPVLSWKTKILSIKEIPAGTKVGYNRTFTARKKSRIAVLPVGYADGYPRSLSNRAHVLIHGRKAPIRGIVCMDLMMVDVTYIPQARINDEAVLIGQQGRFEIRAEDLARLAGTISYEIFCRISERVKRVFIV